VCVCVCVCVFVCVFVCEQDHEQGQEHPILPQKPRRLVHTNKQVFKRKTKITDDACNQKRTLLMVLA